MITSFTMIGDRSRQAGLTPSNFECAARSIAIVGNGPSEVDFSTEIDAAEIVVRFNNASGFQGHAGRRVTHLALVNFGGQMREWLETPDFIDRPVVTAALEFIFPFPPDPLSRSASFAAKCKEPGETDWTMEAFAMLQPLKRPVRVLSSLFNDDARELLCRPGALSERPIPSTGFLVAKFFLDHSDCPIDLYGFGFAGWEGHSWEREREWALAMSRLGRLRLHPAGLRRSSLENETR